MNTQNSGELTVAPADPHLQGCVANYGIPTEYRALQSAILYSGYLHYTACAPFPE